MSRRRRTKNDLVFQVGARIRDLRVERRLTLRKLASIGGCSAFTVMAIELGRSSITVHTLARIARALGVQPFDLLNHDVERNNVGFLIEAMRNDPQCIQFVRERVLQMAE